MKKEYINPRLEVIKIKTALMLVPGSANLDTDTNHSITNSDEFGAREYDFDEDEY